MSLELIPSWAGFAPDLLEQFHNFFINNNCTLSVAESCTAGLLSALIVGHAGASTYYKGGVVSYWNEIKNEILAVPNEILENCGAVSSECARAMAEGVRLKFKTDYALSITGIAGPDGGSAEKPVGTVWIGLASSKGSEAKVFHFSGDRSEIRLQSAYTALDFLLACIRESKYTSF